jgi:hypothetical protein
MMSVTRIRVVCAPLSLIMTGKAEAGVFLGFRDGLC